MARKSKTNQELQDKELIKQALIKKALGYSLDEIVEEYTLDEEGTSKLAKKKITKKFVPADIASVKVLLSHFFKENESDYSNMTEQELLQERNRLLLLLKEEENDDREMYEND